MQAFLRLFRGTLLLLDDAQVRAQTESLAAQFTDVDSRLDSQANPNPNPSPSPSPSPIPNPNPNQAQSAPPLCEDAPRILQAWNTTSR